MPGCGHTATFRAPLGSFRGYLWGRLARVLVTLTRALADFFVLGLYSQADRGDLWPLFAPPWTQCPVEEALARVPVVPGKLPVLSCLVLSSLGC